MTKAHQWIVFDATGTLFQPQPDPAKAYLDCANQHADASRLRIRGMEQLRSRLDQAMQLHFSAESAALPTDEDRERDRWRAIVGDTFVDWPDALLDVMFDQLWHHFADAKCWAIFKDVEPAIQLARSNGLKIAIASNFDRRLFQLIDQWGIGKWFDQVFVSSEVGWCKPNPEFYHEIARRIQSNDPRSLLMIGDTKTGDHDAAIAAGWDARLLVRVKCRFSFLA